MSQPGVPPHPGAVPPPGYPPKGYPPKGYQPQGYPPHPGYRPQPSPEVRRDVEAAWQARLELGLDFEEHIAAGLAERVEELAQQRTRELQAQAETARRLEKGEDSGRGKQFALSIVSLSIGVPITAITATGMDGGNILATAIAWAGIVGVNVAHALSLRRSRRGS